MIPYALFDTAIGRCGVAWSARGVAAVQLPQTDETQTRRRLTQRSAIQETSPPPAIAEAIEEMIGLLAGEKRDLAHIAVDLDGVPDFNREVFRIARSILPGSTLTYGDIAKQLGGVHLSRDVGQALGRNPCPIVVPCHRVLAAGDKPGGFSANGGVKTKLRMLLIEGAVVNHTPSLFDA